MEVEVTSPLHLNMFDSWDAVNLALLSFMKRKVIERSLEWTNILYNIIFVKIC